MNRMTLIVAVSVAFLPMLGAQDRRQGTLPPGPAPGPTDLTWLVNALFVQANMIEGGEVMFMVPMHEPDPEKVPLPSISVKVDAKAIRAFGVDRKPLDITELNKRLSLRAPAVVVHGQAPDPFFLKILSDRAVIFVVPRKLFDHMANTARDESLQGWWAVKKRGAKQAALSDDHWIIDEKKIAVHRDGKLDGYMTYKMSAADYPRTIDLTPDRGPARGKTLKGIYDLDGNTLKICHVAPTTERPEKVDRPKEFGAKWTVTIVFECMHP